MRSKGQNSKKSTENKKKFPELRGTSKNSSNTKKDSAMQGRNSTKPGVSFAEAVSNSSQNDEVIRQLLATIESLRHQIDEMNKRQDCHEMASLGNMGFRTVSATV